MQFAFCGSFCKILPFFYKYTVQITKFRENIFSSKEVSWVQKQHHQPTRAGVLSCDRDLTRSIERAPRSLAAPSVPLSHLHFPINFILQPTRSQNSQRQRRDIGRGCCDSKAAPLSSRRASVEQTNCSRVTATFLPFLCPPASSSFCPCPPVKIRVELATNAPLPVFFSREHNMG